jgi:succinoglycan biosynthesis transport protein ExoP
MSEFPDKAMAGRNGPAPTQASGPAGPRPEQDVHLLDRLAVVYRYRRVAAAVFALTAIGMMVQGYSNITMFRTHARVLIEDERSTAMPGITGSENAYWDDPEPYRQTQYRILKGRELTRRVVARLKLHEVPEFNGSAPPPVTPVTRLKKIALGWAGIAPEPPASTLEAPKADETGDESALIDAFLGRVDVVPVAGSKLVDLYFTSTDAKFAATAANTLIDEYVDQNLEVKLQGTRNMLAWLSTELVAQQEKVEQSERALSEYRDRENALSLDQKNNIVLSRLNALNDALLRARTQRIEKEAAYNQVKSLAASTSPDALPSIAQNGQIQQIKAQLNDLQRQKAQMSERYGDRHPEMQKVNASLADVQRQLDLETSKGLQSIRNEYERALLEERTLSQNLDAAKVDVQDLSRKNVSYSVLEREAESNRGVYDALLQREKELRVSSTSRANNVRVVDRAEIPGAPLAPTGRRTWLLAVVVGLAAAVGVAYGLDYMNDTVKTPEDVSEHLKLPFLGLVPSVPGDKHPLLASSHVPHDFGESFRAVRTSLLSSYEGPGTKLLVFTSAQPLEGKTTTAVNVAMALAYGGSRVLIVDADMRRPGLHHPLRLANERGLAQVLAGQARVRDVIQRTVDPNLVAITAGPPPPNPSEMLSSERMRTLLTNLAHGPFDWIIIDTPPVLAVTDAVVVAPMVTGVVFVVGAEMTRRRLAERAVQTILAARPKQVGAVLNKVDFARNRYYYSRYYGHQYKNYYAQAG